MGMNMGRKWMSRNGKSKNYNVIKKILLIALIVLKKHKLLEAIHSILTELYQII